MAPPEPAPARADSAGAPSGTAERDEDGAPPPTPLDLRLVLAAAAAWLATLFCLHRSPGWALGIGAAAAVLGGLVLLGGARWRRGLSRAAAAGALALFAAALVLLPLAGRLAHARASPLTALAAEHARVTLTLRLAGDPRLLAAKGVAGAPRVAVDASAEAVVAGNRRAPVDGAVLVLADAAPWRDLLPGQRVRVDGALQPPLEGGYLSVTLFARTDPVRVGRPPWWQRMAGRVRASLREAATVLPDQERGLLPGLVDGDTANLDPVLAERFRLAGLTHLVAVSGTNCSIVVGAVLLVLRRARARPWVAAGVGVIVLLMFVVVARPSPSVLRAAVMGGIALAALATGRPRAALPGVAAAVLALLLWQPALAASASFTMSVLATAALLVLAPGWAAALRRRRVPIGLAESIAVAAAAHLVTAPVVAALSGRVSLVAVFANVLAEPVVAVITVLGFAAAVVAPVWLDGGTALAWVAGWPCRWLVAVADRFGGLHGATVPWPGGAVGGLMLLALLVVLGAASLRLGVRRVMAAAAATALVIFIPVRSATSGWPPPGWFFVACDVGQGDGLVLRAGAGSAVVVDAGPDPVPIDRCLRDLGITQIPLLVLSHFHLDHVGGLLGLIRGRSVARLITGPLDDPAAGSVIVHLTADRDHLAIQTPPVGTVLRVGDLRLDVLGPPFAYHGTHSDPNNSSLVLRATVGGVRVLLPGDGEIEAQRELLASGTDLRADVLKVAHHGSAYFDPRFLAAVHASAAVISVGAHNDYGHPSPLLLSALARLGVPVLRTDRDGDVALTGSPGRLRAVARGLASSTVGLPAAGVAPTMSSPPDARMAACRPVPSPSTISPPRSPASSWSSVTRSCSSNGPSARSPPPLAAPIPTSSRAP
jgi:competence protein ComEC